jgi:predicted ABC-type ATPase
MDKNNLDKTMPDSEASERNVIRGKAKSITELRQRLALLGRNGLIINGTGDDVEKYKKIKERLEELGYETSMVSVVTADEVSRKRNIERGQRGGRAVPEDIRKEKWDSVTKARVEMAKMFGDNYVEFDNSEDLRTAAPEVVKQKKDEMLDIFKRIKEFVGKPPATPESKEWVANELNKKDTLPVPKEGDAVRVVERFIRDKYEHKRYIGKIPPKHSEVSTEPQQETVPRKTTTAAVTQRTPTAIFV